jgi:ABC-type Fe3+-hydroxamate transport system substrate-binding protein
MSKCKYSVPFLLILLTAACGSNNSGIRIVSLSTTHSETLLELGASKKLVAVDMYVEMKNSEDIQRIDAFLVNTEDILQLRPTHVIMAFPNDKLRKDLERRNIKVLIFPPARNLEEVYSQISSISELVKAEEKAEKIVSEMKEEADLITKEIKPTGKRIYHELGYTYGIYSVNEKSLIGSFYETLGFNNIITGDNTKNNDGYPKVPEYIIIQKNPEIIIVGHRETLRNEIENRPSWGRISAVIENKIFYIDENLANNWGISSVELLRTIAIETEVLSPRQEKKVDINFQQIYIVVIAVLVLIMRRKGIIKEKT